MVAQYVVNLFEKCGLQSRHKMGAAPSFAVIVYFDISMAIGEMAANTDAALRSDATDTFCCLSIMHPIPSRLPGSVL